MKAIPIILVLFIFSVASIPNKYDYRVSHRECPHTIVDQGTMGSAVLIVASKILADRFCLANKQNLDLSANYMGVCCLDCARLLLNAFRFLEAPGTVTHACFGRNTTCLTKCIDGSAMKFYKAKSFRKEGNVPTIQTEIYENGPVAATMSIYQDFLTYAGGVYEHKSGSFIGEHAVTIMGWGYHNTTNFWIGANTWGPNWGEDGFFRIAFHTADLESFVYSVTPDI